MLAVETKLDPYTLVAALYGAIDRQDYKAVLELVTPNAKFHLAGNPERMDKDGFIDTLKMFFTAFPDLRHRINEIVVDGDKACVRLVGTGTHKGDFQGLAATGHYGEAESMIVFRLENGRIAEAWTVIDILGILTAIQGPEIKKPKSEEQMALVRQGFDVHNAKGDFKGLDRLLSASYVHHDPRLPEPEVYGRDAYKEVLKGFVVAFPDYQLTIDDIFSSGDKVVTRWTFTATHQGEFNGIPATNKPVKGSANSVFRLRNGQIAEAWFNFDFATLMRQIGASQG